MLETKVAKRYAKSLIDLAKEKGMVDTIMADLKLFLSVCRESRDLVNLLANPIIHTDKKLGVVKAVFGSKMNDMTNAFFDIVIRKGRAGYLYMIAKEFVEQFKVLKGIKSAEIVSAVGLDDELRKKVYELVKQGTNAEVELTERVDKKLIGGFILRMGDKQFDASIASELRRLAQSFAQTTVRKN